MGILQELDKQPTKAAIAYWEAFRNGFLRMGGKDYPHWTDSRDEPGKEETKRIMRHALETMHQPTKDMVYAGVEATGGDLGPDQVKTIWLAMFEASLPDTPKERKRPTPTP